MCHSSHQQSCIQTAKEQQESTVQQGEGQQHKLGTFLRYLPPGSCDILASGGRAEQGKPQGLLLIENTPLLLSPSSNSDFVCQLHPNYAKLKHAGGCNRLHNQQGHCFSPTTELELFWGRRGMA